MTRLQNVKDLHPVVVEQSKAYRETGGQNRLPLTAKHVILAVRESGGLIITLAPPPSIHSLLNKRNAMVIQADCTLTYTGHNLHLPTSFCQALLQGHTLEIPYPKSPTGLSPLITPPLSSFPPNPGQHVMRVQILLSMYQDPLSRE